MEIKLEVPEPPKPKYGTDPDTVERFYSNKQRTDAVLAFEAEFDQYVPTDLQWSKNDHYFIYGNSMYYYKPRLEEEIQSDISTSSEDIPDEYVSRLSELGLNLNIPSFNNNVEIKNMINSNPKGLPKFISESPQFFEFESVGMNEITPELMTRELLDKIKNTFNGNYTYIPFTKTNMFYLKDDEVFFTNILEYTKDEDFINNQLGFTIIKDNIAYYYAFENSKNWTDKQKSVIELFSKLAECEKLIIIDL